MRILTDADRTARAELRAARRELERLARRYEAAEDAAFLAANDRVIAAEKRLPWWKRLDIDFTTA